MPRTVASSGETRLAVLGSPIYHSKSPALHRGAYAVLGLDWTYDAIDVTAQNLAGFIESRDDSWRGLSLTMPLKREILPLLTWSDPVVGIVGAANTVLLDNGAVRGYNTDVYGVVQALRAAGVEKLGYVQILGGGATAASVVAAAHELGARRILVSVRTPANAERLAVLGAELGIDLTVRGFAVPSLESTDRSLGTPDAVISTLPGGVDPDVAFPADIRENSVLLDVAYEPWPSPLAAAWLEVGGTVVGGIEMLLHQALAQVRIFVGGDASLVLPGEAEVFAAMRATG